jgi:hypothetical protein
VTAARFAAGSAGCRVPPAGTITGNWYCWVPVAELTTTRAGSAVGVAGAAWAAVGASIVATTKSRARMAERRQALVLGRRRRVISITS